jgi:hypothetical protein
VPFPTCKSGGVMAGAPTGLLVTVSKSNPVVFNSTTLVGGMKGVQ